MVETLASEGADHTREGVHQRRLHCGADVADAEAPYSGREGKPVGCIAVADEEPRCGAPGEGAHDLLGKPLSRGVGGHVGEDEASAFQARMMKI